MYLNIYTGGSKAKLGVCAAANYIPKFAYINVVRISDHVFISIMRLN